MKEENIEQELDICRKKSETCQEILNHAFSHRTTH
jgi:hypothetical protein